MNGSERIADGWREAWTKVDDWVDGFYVLVPNLVVGALVFAFLLAIGTIARHSLLASFRRRDRRDLGDMLGDFALWFALLIGLLLGLTIILPTLNPGDLVASLGIGSIAVGFAFKDILQNWLAGLLILLRQPFRRGDQIRVGDVEGTVQRITQRATLIKTYDSRLVVMPNAEIYTQAITVQTAFERRRISLDITVGYDNDVEQVRTLIADTLLGLEGDVLPEPAPQVLCTELGSTSLSLVVRWWIVPTRSAEVASRARAVQAVKEAFQAHGIDPTDPQIVHTRRMTPDAERPEKRPTGDTPASTPSRPSRIGVSEDDPENTVPQDEPESMLLGR